MISGLVDKCKDTYCHLVIDDSGALYHFPFQEISPKSFNELRNKLCKKFIKLKEKFVKENNNFEKNYLTMPVDIFKYKLKLLKEYELELNWIIHSINVCSKYNL